MNINVKDFLTECHKQQIQDKITKAIENLDQSKINKEVQHAVINHLSDNLSYIIEDISIDTSKNLLEKSINNILKKAFNNIK